MPECHWTEDSEGNWFTDCDEGFVIENGTPEENSMKYCCYCGKLLKQQVYAPPSEAIDDLE